MGVKSCSRRDCDNIMCDKYSSDFGYICYYCLNELRDYQKIKPEMNMMDISDWLYTPKKQNNDRLPFIDLDRIYLDS